MLCINVFDGMVEVGFLRFDCLRLSDPIIIKILKGLNQSYQSQITERSGRPQTWDSG